MWNSKPKKRTCNCRRRARHAPKISGGICHPLDYRDAVRERIASKRLARAWLDVALSGETDDTDLWSQLIFMHAASAPVLICGSLALLKP